MKPILEKKGFKLFFHNKATDKTLPVGWTGTPKGMITKCKKLLRENEGSHFEYTFEADGPIIELTLETLTTVIETIYSEDLKEQGIVESEMLNGTVSGHDPDNPEPEPEIKLKEHPKKCLNCGEENITYERLALTNGEYVCDECGWGMNALTGEITNIGETKPIPEKPKHITEPHAVKHQAAPKHLLCSSKNCDHEILISGNLEYRHGTKIYLVCPECGHKTKVHKVDTTNSLSYAVGAENKGTLIRPDGPKKHMNKKARLRIKRREN